MRSAWDVRTAEPRRRGPQRRQVYLQVDTCMRKCRTVAADDNCSSRLGKARPREADHCTAAPYVEVALRRSQVGRLSSPKSRRWSSDGPRFSFSPSWWMCSPCCRAATPCRATRRAAGARRPRCSRENSVLPRFLRRSARRSFPSPRATPRSPRPARTTHARETPTAQVGAPAASDAFGKVADDCGAAADLFAKTGPTVGELASKSATVAGAALAGVLMPGSFLIFL